MAAWMTVYCRKPLAGVTAAPPATAVRAAGRPARRRKPTTGVTARSLLVTLEATDLYIAAEACGLDDEDAAVGAILPYLRVEEIGDNRGQVFRVHYRPGDLRQVDVHLWTDPEVVVEELDEAGEWLEELGEKTRKEVLQRLKGVVAVVAVEIGWTQVESVDMGVVLASEVANHYAREADGVLRDWDDAWWVVTRGGRFKKVG